MFPELFDQFLAKGSSLNGGVGLVLADSRASKILHVDLKAMKFATGLRNTVSPVLGIEIQTVAVGILNLFVRIRKSAGLLTLEHTMDVR